jgi:protein AIR1/2
VASPGHGEISSKSTSNRKRSSPGASSSHSGEPNGGMESRKDGSQSPRKRVKVDDDVANRARELKAGTIEVLQSTGQEPLQTSESAVEAPPKARSGWNRGVSNGLRTSFAGAAKDRFARSSLARAPESPASFDAGSVSDSRLTGDGEDVISPAQDGQSESERVAEEPARNGAQPASVKTTSQKAQEPSDWVMPPPASPAWHSQVKGKHQSVWEQKFVDWCKTLLQLNWKKIRVDTARGRNRVFETYSKWIGTVDGLSKNKAAAARRAAVDYSQTAQFVADLADIPPPSEPQPMDPLPSVAEDKVLSAAAIKASEIPRASIVVPDGLDSGYRARYFPGIGPDETFCLMCATRGHDSTECPEMACRFCPDAGKHPSFSCPTRLRCIKCRQLGHTKKDCQEKLALAPEEMECAFCQSPDHLEASCSVLWRSFSFNPDTVRKVRSLPIFCYCCGRQGHYGPVCGLNPQRADKSQCETWSQLNCDRYIDPASTEVAIAFSGSGVNSASSYDRPDLGKSIVPRRHIIFEEAEDEENEGFIRPPVQKTGRTGHIVFSNNSRFNNPGETRSSKQSTASYARGGYSRAEPPLPPGPPPPLPPQGYREDSRPNGGQRARKGKRERNRSNY